MNKNLNQSPYIFFGPLGWKKSVWDKINKVDNTIFFEFPNESMNLSDIRENVVSRLDDLNNITIIASSYGVWVLLYVLPFIYKKVKKVILIDGLSGFFSEQDIQEAYINRQEDFATITEILDTYLTEEERKDLFLQKVVSEVYNEESKKHSMSNQVFKKYLSFFSNEERQTELLENIDLLYNDDIETVIFSSAKLNYKQFTIIEIDEEDHLLMLTKPVEVNNFLID